MSKKLPAISGNELIKLLQKDNWEITRKATHGVSLKKFFPDGRYRVTIIPTSNESLPKGTLAAILGPKQTNLGHDGLIELLKK
ncbi:MAG: type II toxin-antitoxin system HicA family toxin [Candidatus Thorarchaeota archaeon]